MPLATRTLNPIHFEDLEPHRFEDLVRQLVYDFRSWDSIEAVGRSGADAGMDIRAYERFGVVARDEDGPDASQDTREWRIQCKRERRISPARVRKIVRECLARSAPPFGFVLAAACDFSLKTRTAFRDSVLRYGVVEHHVWGKAELEDMLFLPEHDYLLFGYFGISLRARRRTIERRVRRQLSNKRALLAAIRGSVEDLGDQPVVLMDPRDTNFPSDVPSRRKWNFVLPLWVESGGMVLVEVDRYPAWYDEETGSWDAMAVHEESSRELAAADGPRFDILVCRQLSLDRIIAVDELGDCHSPDAPRVLVDYANNEHPFDGEPRMVIRRYGSCFGHIEVALADRVARFSEGLRAPLQAV